MAKKLKALVTNKIQPVEVVTPKTTMKYEDKLWCERCQRGVGGNNHEKYTEGDICPMCLDRYRHRHDKMQISGELKKISTVLREKAEIAELRRRQKEQRTIRGVKGAGELVREAEDKFKAENDALRQELAQIKDLLKNKPVNNTGSGLPK